MTQRVRMPVRCASWSTSSAYSSNIKRIETIAQYKKERVQFQHSGDSTHAFSLWSLVSTEEARPKYDTDTCLYLLPICSFLAGVFMSSCYLEHVWKANYSKPFNLRSGVFDCRTRLDWTGPGWGWTTRTR